MGETTRKYPTIVPAESTAASAGPVGADGSALPQTDDKPSTTSTAFRERMDLVARAILSGDPAPAPILGDDPQRMRRQKQDEAEDQDRHGGIRPEGSSDKGLHRLA